MLGGQAELADKEFDSYWAAAAAGFPLILASQMYVPGKLHDVEHVLIDGGTGYYVEKVSGREHKNASLRGRASVQNGLPLIHSDLADS